MPVPLRVRLSAFSGPGCDGCRCSPPACSSSASASPRCAPAASAASANLLVNGDFAAGSTSGWTCSSGDTVVTSPVYSGSTYALAGTPTDSDYARCSQVVSVQPSSSYSLSGWVEGDYVYLGDSGTGGTDTSDWTPSAATGPSCRPASPPARPPPA